MVIKYLNLNHTGGFYLYSVHKVKTNELTNNGLSKLKFFLEKMFNECPDKYFQSGPRSSALKFKIGDINVKPINGHEVSSLARVGLSANKERYNQNHPRVQNFMLENDGNTIAVEVPIWLEKDEINCYKILFNSEEPLSGHIDVLRIEDEKIWIWDYKPKAEKEKYASTQVYFYALMLSNRTGIPLENFRCGYFDENYAYVFKPTELEVVKESEIKEFI